MARFTPYSELLSFPGALHYALVSLQFERSPGVLRPPGVHFHVCSDFVSFYSSKRGLTCPWEPLPVYAGREIKRIEYAVFGPKGVALFEHPFVRDVYFDGNMVSMRDGTSVVTIDGGVKIAQFTC